MRILLPLALLLLLAACERRKQIHAEGTVRDAEGQILHWQEYIWRDTFFREVRKNSLLMSKAFAATEKEFRDSTFSETDFFPNGKPLAQRHFVKGIQNNTWKSWYDNGTLKSVSLVSKGVLKEYFSYYDNGNIAVSAVRKPDGTMFRTERWNNGQLKQEFTTDSTGNGNCTEYHPNGKRSGEGRLLYFSPSGIWSRWDSTGNALQDTLYGLPEIE